MGGIVDLARRYAAEGADELVFYDITASSDERVVDKSWVSRVAEVIDIPFCVAGGIKAWRMPARSWNSVPTRSPSTPRPGRSHLITRLAERFGVQCVVVGIDSYFDAALGQYQVKQFTGDESRTRTTTWTTLGGYRKCSAGRGRDSAQRDEPGRHASGYDLEQLKLVRAVLQGAPHRLRRRRGHGALSRCLYPGRRGRGAGRLRVPQGLIPHSRIETLAENERSRHP